MLWPLISAVAFANSLDDRDLLLEAEAGWTDDPHVDLGWEEPPAIAVPNKEPWRRRAAPIDLPGASDGALRGKAVYLSQCHGYIWYESLGRFSTQRPNLFDTVEDFHNPEGANQYLIRYLENAGASVFTARERDLNPQMAIVDDGDPGYQEVGAGFQDGLAGFADRPPYRYGVDPFDAGTTRRFPADGGGRAVWTPDIPEDGYYAVYVSWDADADHATNAHYRITHSGGVIDRSVDQTVHGSTWQYLEWLWLPEGPDSLTVELIADSDQTGRWLSADAVRVGGGISEVERFGQLSGRDRWEEGAIQYAQFNGAPPIVYDPYDDGDGSDPAVRSRWAAWEHPTGEPAVYLSWHSNAGGGQGTSTYIYEGTYSPVPGSDIFGALVQEELIDTIRTRWDSGWSNRGVRTAAFSELSPLHNPEMPAALVELAFHDLESDAAVLKEPRFRQDAARAMMRAVVRYFAAQSGETPVFLPEPPGDVALLHTVDGELELTWSPGPSGAPLGDPAVTYRVFRSQDGRSWDNGTPVSGTAMILDAEPGDVVYARVAAVNDGGVSFPSEVMGARKAWDGVAPVLIVAGFDRLRASNLLRTDVGGSLGEVVRMNLPQINNFDGVVLHGETIEAWPFESAADERLTGLDLSARSRLVWWIAGEESSQDTTVDAEQQAALAAFQDAGGVVWITGAEVLWDLDRRGSEADRAFAEQRLGALMEADDAGTLEATGEGVLDNLILDFGAGYPVEYPDVLLTDDEVLARYGTGGVAAAWGEGRVLFGFPFETIQDPVVRIEVTSRMLPALVPDYQLDDIVDDDTPDDDTPDDDTPDDDTPDDDSADEDSGTVTEASPGLGSRSQDPEPQLGCSCDGGATGWVAGWWILFAAAIRRRRG
ncbi:MAG: N-acetylmuramoyl-L-alanine amidase [Myxococcota bacterium]